MDKVPEIPSKNEDHAQVRSRGEDKKLASRREVLDKVRQPPSPPQARAKRSPRRQSDPVVIQIFRKQEDRRLGVRAAQDAVLKDEESARQSRWNRDPRSSRKTAAKLLKYQEVSSDADEEDSSSSSSGEGETVIVVPGFRVADVDSGADGLTLEMHGANAAGRRSDQTKGGGRPIRKPKATAKGAGTSKEERGDTIGKVRTEDVKTEKGENADKDRRAVNTKGRRTGIGNVRKEEDPGTSQKKGPTDPKEYDKYISADPAAPVLDTLTVPEEQDTTDPKQKPRRKRSYSDGNIFFNIYEVVRDKDSQPYLVAKSTQAACDEEASSGKRWSEDGTQQPERRVAYGWGGCGDAEDFDDSVVVPREETYVIENNNNNYAKQTHSPSPTRRVVYDVPFQLPDADETLSPRFARKRIDVDNRTVPSLPLIASPPLPSSSSSSSSSSDIKGQPRQQQRQQRRHGTVTPADIKLAPSLKQRLAGGGGSDSTVNTPRRTEPEVSVVYSPSLNRRLVTGASVSQPNAKQRGVDPASSTGSPKPLRRNAPPPAEAETIPRPLPRQNRRHEADEAAAETSRSPPRLARRDAAEKPSPRPKPIYQQTDPKKKKNAAGSNNRRPLRRSRSEMFFDQAVYIIPRDRPDFPDIATPRRGSNPFVAGEGASPSWTSTGEEIGRRWDSLAYGLALSQQEREDISRHKRMQLVTSLRQRQEEVDNDDSRRIRTFLTRYNMLD